MEDIRNYRIEDDTTKEREEDRRQELESARKDEEVPFHIPRD